MGVIYQHLDGVKKLRRLLKAKYFRRVKGKRDSAKWKALIFVKEVLHYDREKIRTLKLLEEDYDKRN